MKIETLGRIVCFCGLFGLALGTAWGQGVSLNAVPQEATATAVHAKAAIPFDSDRFGEAYDRVSNSRTGQGAGTSATLGAAASPVESLGGVLAQLVFSLAVVIGLIYGGSYLLKHFVGKGILHTTGPLKVLSKHSLSQKSNLYIVSAFDRFLIIGETPQGLTCLSEFDDPDENLRLKEQWGWDWGAPGARGDLYSPRNSPFGPSLESHVNELERELQRIKGVTS